QSRYGKMDSRIGFSASNRSNYILGRRSNCSWGPVITGLKNQRNWSRFNYISTIMSAMVKRMAALDSAHQIGPSTLLKDDLIVVWGSSSLDFKKQRNRSRF